MKSGAALENLTAATVEICRSGLPPEALRDRVLPRLRRAVPFDAAFWATVDPTTLLFTRAHQEEIPPETIPYFIQNEFLDADVNKWTALAGQRMGVRTLYQPTGGDMEASPRSRDVFRPLGLGDELRAVLRVGGACWGYMCLHREAGVPFSNQEVAYVHRLAPHLAEGIRAGSWSRAPSSGTFPMRRGWWWWRRTAPSFPPPRRVSAGSRSSDRPNRSARRCQSRSRRSPQGSAAPPRARADFHG